MSTVTETDPEYREVEELAVEKFEFDEEPRIIEAAQKVQEEFQGVKVKISQMPYQKALTVGQKKEATEKSGADVDSVIMARKLFMANEPAVKRVREVISEIDDTWKSTEYTLPHPEPGMRLILEDQIPAFDAAMERLEAKLDAAAKALDAEMPLIRERMKKKHKKLYNEGDYSFSAVDRFHIFVSYPSAQLPNYLMRLKPEMGEAERQRVREIATREMRRHMETFQTVVKMKEQEIAEALFLSLDAIVERLEGKDTKTGKRKVFKSATATKLLDQVSDAKEQLERFGIGAGPLAESFGKLERIVRGYSSETLPEALKTSEGFREHVRAKATTLAKQVMNKAVPQQRRKVLRKRASSKALA